MNILGTTRSWVIYVPFDILFVDVVQFKISPGTGLWNGMTSADYYVNGIHTNNLNDACAIRPTTICTRPYLNDIGNHHFQKVI